jgi:hypothetical protein
MKAKFEIRSIKQKWKPPFTKDIREEVFEVEEGESFDKVLGNGNNESVFKLVESTPDRAKVQYSKLFTLKTPNPGNYLLSLPKDEAISMTYLWGEDGVTKKITFKGLA